VSEKIFALLLRLFPPEFRARYGEEAMQLYRDRSADETGLARRVRLGFDLLLDLFRGLSQAWQMSYAAASASSETQGASLVPSFRLLYREPLRPASIVLGSMLSITILGVSVLVLRNAALHPHGFQARSPIDAVLQHVNHPMTPEARGSDGENALAEIAANAKTPIAPPGAHGVGAAADGGSPPREKAIPVSPAAAGASHGREEAKAVLTAGASPKFAPTQAAAPRGQSASSRLNIAQTESSLKPREVAAGARAVSGAISGQRMSEGIRQASSVAAPGQIQPLAAQDATRAMIAAITTHPVVMFGETHANKQEYDWLCKLVKTPGFADRVDDIVVEFGNSLYQKTVDRYIAGDDVPEAQIEKAWRNMIGSVGPVSPVYGEFYEAVRASNLARHDGHRIRLLLGDPYGDWDKIKDAEDLGPFLAHRDQWYAQVVKDEVLAKNHRALLIMGAGHFERRNGPGLVEHEIRASGVDPYLVVFGTNVVGGYDDVDPRFNAFHPPAIVPLKGTWVGDLLAMPVLTGGMVAPNAVKMADVADAMFYAGPRDGLLQVNVPRAELDDTAYGKEVNRRLMIEMGRTMEFTAPAEEPQYRRPAQQTVSNGVHLTPPNPPKSIDDPLPPRPPSQ
jgi:hypothetical protein